MLLGGRLSVCVVFVVLFLLYIVHTYSTEQSLLGRSYSRMSSIYGSNPFKTRSCKQVDPMYYCLDQYIHCVVALHSECFEKRVEIIPNQVNVIKIFNSVPEIYISSAPNNSNETQTFICLGRAGPFGQH